jgi:hypothetical protein
MMIRYLTHHEIDKIKWDKLIDQSFNGLIYAYSWYLDVVSPQWDAIIENDYENVMPLIHKRKLGILYIYPPVFTQQLGVFSEKKISPHHIEELLSTIPEKFKYIEMYLNASNHFSGKDFTFIERVNYELNLNKTYEDINKNYNQETKRNLKLAQKCKIQIKNNAAYEAIVELFINNRGKNLKSIKPAHYNTLKKIILHLQKIKGVEIYGAYNFKGNLCAGAFFIQSHNRSIFIFSATNDEAKKTGAMRLLIDQFIQQHCESDHILDFEGSSIANLARFYKGFGPKESVYLQIKQNKLPSILKWIKKTK